MSTRFYLPSTAPPDITPTPHVEWDNTASFVRRLMGPTRISSPMSSPSITDATATANRDVLHGQFISAPIAAQTISGTIDGQLRASESASASNLRSQMIAYVVSADGATVRSPLLYAGDLGTQTNNPSEEWVLTTLTNTRMPRVGGVTLNSVTAQDGDRIVIEIGYRKHANASTTGAITFGDNSATDLTAGGAETTANNPWIEFSATIAPYLPTGTVLDTFAGTDGTLLENHTPSGGGTWTKHPLSANTASITSGRLHPTTNSEAQYVHSWTPATSSYAVQATLIYRGGTAESPGICARMSATTDDYYQAAYDAGANQRWLLRKVVGGTFTTIGMTATGSAVLTQDQGYVVRLDVTNAMKIMYVDGVEVLRSADNAITAAGYPGFRTFGGNPGSQPTAGTHCDDFMVIGSGANPSSGVTGDTSRTALTATGVAVASGAGATGSSAKVAMAATGKALTGSSVAQASVSATARVASGKAVTSGAEATGATTTTSRTVSGKTLTGAIHASATTTRTARAVSGKTVTAGAAAGASINSNHLDLLARSVVGTGTSTGSVTTTRTALAVSAKAITSTAQARALPLRKAMTLIPSALSASAVGSGTSFVSPMTATGKTVTGIGGSGVVGATTKATVTLSAKALAAAAATTGLPSRSARTVAYRPLVGTAGSADVGTTLRRTMTVIGRSVVGGAQGVATTTPRVINVSGRNVAGVAIAPTLALGATSPDILVVSARNVSALTTRPDGFGHYPFGHGPFGHAPDVGTSVGSTTRKAMNAVGQSMVAQANGRATPTRKTLTIIGSAVQGRGTVSQTGTTTRKMLSVVGNPVVASTPTGSVGVTARRVLVLSRKTATAGVGITATTSPHTLTLDTTTVEARDRIFSRSTFLVGV